MKNNLYWIIPITALIICLMVMYLNIPEVIKIEVEVDYGDNVLEVIDFFNKTIEDMSDKIPDNKTCECIMTFQELDNDYTFIDRDKYDCVLK